MKLTSEDYQAVLDDDLSPMFRGEYEYRRDQAEKRETLNAAMTERSRKERLVHRWQSESLRVFHQCLAKQFEVVAWGGRASKPRLLPEARNALERKRRGVVGRLVRARREAAEGCLLQAAWLELHAELIEALEQP